MKVAVSRVQIERRPGLPSIQPASFQKGDLIMAHEISNVNGINEAFYALRPAWHGLGTVLSHAPTSQEAITAAHLDWRVSRESLHTAGGVEVPEHFATVRQDTGAVLGVVGSRYQIVQNREAFDFLDGLLQDGVMKYESAGALRGGRIVWLLARLPSVDTIAEGDNTLRYVLFNTSHDGSASIHAIPTSVRVVCANTLRIATAGDIGFRHTANVASKLEFAKRYLSQFDEKFTLFRDKARTLATRRYSPDDAKAYIDTLFPPVKEIGRSRSIRENKVAAVRSNFRNSRQSIPSIKGTWWSLFNAVTEAVDHEPAGRSRKALDLEHREQAMLSKVDGHGADFKAKAFSLALDMAG
jgi:phage/plasmid-like protein (TIGR03299 family)